MVLRLVRNWRDGDMPKVAYTTDLGRAYRSTIEDFLQSRQARSIAGQVDLILTSPPFPLASPKAYGNRREDEYIDWISETCAEMKRLLSPRGSLVVEIGNAWESGSPSMSTATVRALLAIADKGDFKVSQQFICNNPARLPSPAQWVTVKRIRVKDSFTHVWWYSASAQAKADNRKVLVEYSPAMKKLLQRKTYNTKSRPSDHDIGEKSFLTDNGGAIPSSVLQFSNTAVSKQYRDWCQEHGVRLHPARMPDDLADFFIRLTTDEGDLVLDPFAGSQTTGAVAERLGRRWIGIEPDSDYLWGSVGRFR